MRAGKSPEVVTALTRIHAVKIAHACWFADVLFRSVASAYGPSTLAVVMTGMGSDGLLGSQKIVEAGGQVIVQDEASSVVWGMPGAVYNAGHADAAYPLSHIAGEITRRVRESHNRQHSQTNSIADLQNTHPSVR